MSRLRLSISILLASCSWLAASATPIASGAALYQDSRLHYGTLIQANITDTDTEHEWVFSGHTGDLVVVDMRALDATGLDPYLTLLDPQGNTLVTDDDSGEGVNARVGPLVLDGEGDYVILASRYSGSGTYTLSLTNLSTAPELSPGKPVTGLVNAETPYDYYLIAGLDSSEQLLRLTIHDDNPSGDPFLSLYGPNGLITTTEFLEEDTSGIDPIVTEDGILYTVIVSWNGATISTPYELVLESSTIDLLEDGNPQSGWLDYDTTSQRHFFRADAGQQVSIRVTTEDAIAPSFTVSTLDRTTVLFRGEGTYARDIQVTLAVPNTVMYMVEVSDGAFSGETGQYEIALERGKSQ